MKSFSTKYLLLGMAALVLYALGALAAIYDRPQPAANAGLAVTRFEGGHGSLVTIGCSLVDTEQVDPDVYDGDKYDFYLAASRDELLLIAVGRGDGQLHMISGEQCGISIDHTVVPQR